MIAEQETLLEAPREEDVFVFPATAAQRRFWTLHQMTPGGNPALNMAIAVRLNGTLNLPALEYALQEIVARHEVLRTTFHLKDGRLSQVIASSADLTVTEMDVDDFPEEQRLSVPEHLIREEAQRPFDLARGPLVRARLVRVSGSEHLLLLTLHHIICDGWSNGIVLRELAALYGAFIAGKPSPLPELTLQFADYADWQQEAMAGPGMTPHFDYWRKQLAGEWPALELPYDHPRRGGGNPAGGIRWRPLPVGLARDLKSLANQDGVSGYMVGLAAFNALLHRMCPNRPEDIVISSPCANRNRAEVESLVGLFVNPLLLRTRLEGDPTFRELLTRVRQTSLAAFFHGDAPFEWVIDKLEPRRLQVSFLHQQAFLKPARLTELTMTPLRSVSGGAVFEWTLGVIEDAAGLWTCLEYNADLFDEATIDRTLEHFQTLLEEIVANPDRRLSEFSLPTNERRAPEPLPAGLGRGVPNLTVHYQIIEIWQDVLGVAPIGIHDDFFALGGNSLLALRMLTRVEAVCGKSLSPASLFKNATIEFLARELLSNPEGKSPAILKLQEGGAKTPLFYLHGDITGGGYYTMRLSRGLGPEQPFYALPPVDVETVGGMPSIEEMAAMHVEAIRSMKPHGPYAVGGFCIGGLVAYEVAQQLRQAGETVEQLIIIDATIENRLFKWLRRRAERVGARRQLDDNGKLYLFSHWHLLWARSKRWLGLGFGEQAAILRKRLGNQLRRLLPKEKPVEKTEDSASWYDPQWDTPLVFLWATGGYYAQPYPGKVTLLLSSDLANGPERDPAIDWKKYAPNLLTRNVPGAHLASITEHVETLTEAVRESLA